MNNSKSSTSLTSKFVAISALGFLLAAGSRFMGHQELQELCEMQTEGFSAVSPTDLSKLPDSKVIAASADMRYHHINALRELERIPANPAVVAGYGNCLVDLAKRNISSGTCSPDGVKAAFVKVVNGKILMADGVALKYKVPTTPVVCMNGKASLR